MQSMTVRLLMHCIAVLSMSMLIVPAPAGAESGEVAKSHFEKGVALYNMGSYSGALVEFEAAYKEKAHFKVRYNIGKTLYALNRYVKAEVELQAFLEEGGLDAPGFHHGGSDDR